MKYQLIVPLTGWIAIELEADNKEEAIGKALYNSDVNVMIEGDDVFDYQWEMIREVTRGNFFFGAKNELTIEELYPPEED